MPLRPRPSVILLLTLGAAAACGLGEAATDFRCPDAFVRSEATESPVQIVAVLKAADPEVVLLTNVSQDSVDLAGWTMCSVLGGQTHRGLAGVIAAGDTLRFARTGEAPIWNNVERDDGALFDSHGRLVSYWNDE